MTTDFATFRHVVSLALLATGVVSLDAACSPSDTPAASSAAASSSTSTGTSGAGGAGSTTTQTATSATSTSTSGGSAGSAAGTGGSAAGTAGAGGTVAGGSAGTAGGAGGISSGGAGGTDAGGTGGTGSRADAGYEAGGVGGSGGSANGDAGALPKFSFFLTSLKAIVRLGGPNGFGGDLRFGKADGLSGADEICRQIAETSMPGSSQKQWRAFLSIVMGPGGMPVHAIDRIGNGPWYDRRGRLFAMTKADLLLTRPRGADPVILNDLPNEEGVPNHDPDGTGQVDNHDVLTGSNLSGRVYGTNWSSTCHDWTSKVGSDGKPRCGHSWPRLISGEHWISSLDEGGCGAGINIVEMGQPRDPTVGSGGGYGGFYCFALTP